MKLTRRRVIVLALFVLPVCTAGSLIIFGSASSRMAAARMLAHPRKVDQDGFYLALNTLKREQAISVLGPPDCESTSIGDPTLIQLRWDWLEGDVIVDISPHVSMVNVQQCNPIRKLWKRTRIALHL